MDIEKIAQDTVSILRGLQLADIEDIEQEVALKLLENEERIKSHDGQMLPYAYRVARNAMIDSLRRLRSASPVRLVSQLTTDELRELASRVPLSELSSHETETPNE